MRQPSFAHFTSPVRMLNARDEKRTVGVPQERAKIDGKTDEAAHPRYCHQQNERERKSSPLKAAWLKDRFDSYRRWLVHKYFSDRKIGVPPQTRAWGRLRR